jgi:DNA-binding LacI/PurR family transcriptional regulator
MGEIAAETLLRRIAGNDFVPRTITVQPEFMVRGTTGPAQKQ